MCSILTVRHLVSCYPLVGILSTFCDYFLDFHRSSKVHFKPLMVIVVACAPGPPVPTPFDCPQPRQSGIVVFVPLWRGCDLLIPDSTTLHTQGFVTNSSCIKIKICENINILEKKTTNNIKFKELKIRPLFYTPSLSKSACTPLLASLKSSKSPQGGRGS